MQDQYFDHLGCFTFKTSIDTFPDTQIYIDDDENEENKEDKENNSQLLNCSKKTYSLLRQSALSQYHTDMSQIEKLIHGLNGEIDSQRQRTERVRCDKQSEIQDLKSQLINYTTESQYLTEANEDFLKENKELKFKIQKLEQVYNQQKEFLKLTQHDFEKIQSEIEKKDYQIQQIQMMFEKQASADKKMKLQQQQQEKELHDIHKQLLSKNQEMKQKLTDQDITNKIAIDEHKIKYNKFEQAFKRLSKIFDPKTVRFDEMQMEGTILKIENVEKTNQQIKQRIKILAEVISKQDNNFKNTLHKMNEDLQEKDFEVKLLQEQIFSQGQVIQDMSSQIEGQKKEVQIQILFQFNECCEGIHLMNKECQTYQIQVNILEQEKKNFQCEMKSRDYLVKNLKSFIFNQESLDLIEEVKITFAKIISIKNLLLNLQQTSQVQDKTKSYEHEKKVQDHKLKTQLQELQQMRISQEKQFLQMGQNEKDCLSMAREIDFLKQERDSSLRLTRDSVTTQSVSRPSSRIKKKSVLGKSMESLGLSNSISQQNGEISLGLNNSVSQQHGESSQILPKLKANNGQSLLAQFLSLRSQKNLNQSLNLTYD